MGVKRANDGYDRIDFRPTKRMKLNHYVVVVYTLIQLSRINGLDRM